MLIFFIGSVSSDPFFINYFLTFVLMNEEIENNELESEDFEQVLRPKGFDDFKGQDQIVDNLKVFIQAAKEIRSFRSCFITHRTSRSRKNNSILYYCK